MVGGHITDDETIERYARHELSSEEEHAFEEHFFSCDECFEKLQATERFIAGVRDAARRKQLGSSAAETRKVPTSWLFRGFALSSCAAVILAAVVIWVFLVRVPALRRQLEQTTAALHTQITLRTEPERTAGAANAAEVNVPFVMLQASRGSELSNEVTLPAGAQHLVLWVELRGESRFRSFSLEVYAPDHRLMEKLSNLKRNSYGAMVVNLSAENLVSGYYHLKLAGEAPAPSSTLGEYRLKIHRPS